VEVEESAPVLYVPFTACVPLHAPEAVQDVALVEDQLNVEPVPLVTLVGLALMETLGGVADTVTVADWLAVPPAPVQVREYFVVAVRAAVVFEPLIGSEPAQPPDAVQAVALVADQVSVEVAPLLTVLGLAAKVTAGAVAVTETDADLVVLPPVPVQVNP
jgi:hypothetical protein